ncbi:MAG: GDSL-type esterase/lipase family protein [Polyangiaceae bacterium]
MQKRATLARTAWFPSLALAVTALVACGDVTGDGTPGRATRPATATIAPDEPSSTANDVPAPASTNNPRSQDAGLSGADASADVGPPLVPHAKPSECFVNQLGPVVGPNYDQFAPKMGVHCDGTQQQKITGVEKLVFLGDSVTAGTPPTPINQFYRSIVTDGIKQRFGQNVAVSDCSKWGARNDDLNTQPGGKDKGQIDQCFPTGVEQKKTLVVMTMGGNDIAAWAKAQLAGPAATTEADAAGDQLATALRWLKDPVHFPNGSYVIFANVYEYTDTSGDVLSCPAAGLSGFKANYAQGTDAIVHFQELYMKHAVETGTDVVFLLENFCGHGYKRDDPKLQCYRGPNTDLWFDLTCYHPNPVGHSKIAEYVLRIVDG